MQPDTAIDETKLEQRCVCNINTVIFFDSSLRLIFVDKFNNKGKH
jgi:hypothetical protein